MGLVPRDHERRSLDTGRKVEVPTRVLPKAELAPNVKLSPMQRLHIEHLTRHPPPKKPPKPYKERLLIYHAGYPVITALVFGRVIAICAAAFVTAVWVPAYYTYGTPWYYLLPVWAGSFVPLLAVNFFTRSIVTEAFLRLPPNARATPQAAMAYARKLPRDATLQLRYGRWTGLVSSVDVRIADTQPTSSRLRPVNFKAVGPLVDKGTFLGRNPTDFFLKPKTAGGRAARDAVPGLWDIVYRRLTGVSTASVSRWKS
ncbi:uncharacterized protein HMPREF1541_06526 [Cyphellophora europaea CBS 101466]|uniref:Uncharacterized protein n=1 Tax=Cyphellophora europaea (strain CBS 101466) TaxID=1220924 RepID=W2RPQ2_CYPE1|nr:uncharacterized protein HMPREF1541_06526 [Cyphellophora europaea CBS 101466]ETN38491.1 hypothetical protein HMPREF1541_06526 [Cyphellophora europaea CBS 101466]